MNKKVFIIGVSIILFLFIGNIIYFNKYRLNKPIFMNHYYEISMYDDDVNFNLYYLVNNDETLDVNYIEIPEFDDFSVGVNNSSIVQERYTYHKLKAISIRIEKEALDDILKNKDKLIFDKIIAHLRNGNIEETNIGQVCIYKINNKLNPDEYLDFQMAGASNQGNQVTTFQVKKPFQLKNIDFNLKNNLEGFLDIYLSKSSSSEVELKNRHSDISSEGNDIFSTNGNKLQDMKFPLKFKKGDHIKIINKFNKKKKLAENYYILTPKLIMENEEGIKLVKKIHMHSNPYFDNSDIKKYVDERR